jgi:hypothetical protein
MNSIVKDIVRHIQIKNKTIAYSPILYRVIIQRENRFHQEHRLRPQHPTQYDESDDLEHQKHMSWRPHRVDKIRWGDATIDME